MKILVVDDEFVALSKMMAVLGEYGQCDAATHAKQALGMFSRAAAKGEPYDLVTIDINLPGMTGLELQEAMRDKEQLKQIPRSKKIIVSAVSSPDNVRRAVANRCDAFLAKPISRDVLQTKLKQLGFNHSDETARNNPINVTTPPDIQMTPQFSDDKQDASDTPAESPAYQSAAT